MKLAFAMSIALAVTGCASVVTQSRPSPVKEALANQVQGCEFLQTVSATSPFYGVFAGSALQSLRDKVLEAAEAHSATHIVITGTDTPYGSTTMHAQAFRCQKS